MKRFTILAMLLTASAFALQSAIASTTASITGRFHESYPKSGPPNCFTGNPCGIGELHGYGQAAESFDLEGIDGRDANGCVHVHGTTTITLNDAQRSSFHVTERDVGCHPGDSHQAPGHFNSYGNPETFSGTWGFDPGTGTGVFAASCGGSGVDTATFSGSDGSVDYSGSLTLC